MKSHAKVDLWSFLHDGYILKITQPSPKLLRLRVRSYLRRVFKESGTHFDVYLNNCEEWFYKDSDNKKITDLKMIVAQTPEILNATQLRSKVRVNCFKGKLYLQYSTAKITLESGKVVTLSNMKKAAKHYWSNSDKVLRLI